MNDRTMFTAIDGSMLAEAFAPEQRPTATQAGEAVARLLSPRQWTERFPVQIEGDKVLIPARLHFASDRLRLSEGDDAWRLARALQTRSNDGFQRQRAARDVLLDLQPWGAPFIVALVGEYVVEILDDISAALTDRNIRTLAAFVVRNQAYWGTTRRRVASYWNVYYRHAPTSDTRRAYRREDYVGFRLIDRLEAAISASIQNVAG